MDTEESPEEETWTKRQCPTYYVCEEYQEVFLSEDEKEVHARVHLTCHICKRVCKDKKGFNWHLKVTKSDDLYYVAIL